MLRIRISLLKSVFTMMGKRKDSIQISQDEASQKAIQKDKLKNVRFFKFPISGGMEMQS